MTTATGVPILRSPCLFLRARPAGRQNPQYQYNELCDMACLSLALPTDAIKHLRNSRNPAGGVDRAT